MSAFDPKRTWPRHALFHRHAGGGDGGGNVRRGGHGPDAGVAFGNCAADWGDVVVINDQAHYALLELFTEIHDAWGRYQRRLSDIEKGSLMPSEAAKQSWVNFIAR
jgi:hypothetical protein